jgi:hypothetical protein
MWEDRWNRPDALIHKASIELKIQTSGRQSAWSGRAWIRYGNCVHQINHPDNHSLGPNARSLYKEITCNGSATVRTTGHHCPDVAQKHERIKAKFSGNRSHSCSSRRPLTTVQTTPMFYQARRSFEPSAYK